MAEIVPLHFFAEQAETIQQMQAAGRDVIALDIGSPDLPPHPDVIAELHRAAQRTDTHGYQSHRGTEKLRRAWSDLYLREFGVSLNPETEVLPLLGSKEGIFHLIQAVVSMGDVVLVPDPGYVTYRRGAEFAGGEVYLLPLRPENDFLPDLSAIPPEILSRASVLWLNYPANPTSACAPLSFLAEAVEFAREHDILLCHDAAYALVSYDGYHPPSLMQVPGAAEVAVEFNSLSKSHNMAGWRLGAVVGSPAVLARLLRLKSNADSGHFLPIMEAAALAMGLPSSWIEERNHIYRQRRDILHAGLVACGFEVALPKAALYLWAKIPGGQLCEDFSRAMLKGTAVSTAPGTVFGPGGEGYLRFSVTQPKERLKEAVDRMREFLK